MATKKAEEGAVQQAAQISPTEFLRSINTERLRADLAAAEEDFNRAFGQLKALRSLARMVRMRDDPAFKGAGRKKRKPTAASDAATQQEADDSNGQGEAAQAREAVILNWMKGRTPCSTATIAGNVHLTVKEVRAMLDDCRRVVHTAEGWVFVDEEEQDND